MAQAGAAISLPPGFSQSTVVSGLDSPVGMAFLPDGRLLIIEKNSGKVRVWAGGVPSTPATATAPGLNTSGSERGLLGIAVDPQFSVDSQIPGEPHIYLFYTHTETIESVVSNKIRVSRFTVGGDVFDNPTSTNLTFTNEVVLLHDFPDDRNNHNGGTLRFGPDGMLYASIGDDAEDKCDAQDVTSQAGQILRMSIQLVDGTFDADTERHLLDPGDNPWSGDADLNKRLVYAYGLRNPFRISVDAISGRVYVGDVGWGDMEETSEGSAPDPGGGMTTADNFAWPYFEGSLPADGGGGNPPDPGCGITSPANHPPLFEYSHAGQGGLSVVGGPIYRGNPYPNNIANDSSFPLSYEGAYFASEHYVGFLRVRLKEPGTGNWVQIAPGVDDFATGLTGGSSDWAVGPDGALYYVSLWNGSIHKISYTGDFDRDGDFDVDDLDDDNDTLTDTAEDLLARLDPKDSDSDDDGIMDGLDEALSNPDNACAGPDDDASYSTPVDSTDVVCATRGSVTMQSPVEVFASYALTLISPTAVLDPGFTIHPGGSLSVLSVDPSAVP